MDDSDWDSHDSDHAGPSKSPPPPYTSLKAHSFITLHAPFEDDVADKSNDDELPPLIIVEGFLSAASSCVWGDFRSWLDRGEAQWVQYREETQAYTTSSKGKATQPPSSSTNSACPRRVIFAPIGPVSSLHDRACELYYALRGGTVDYGAEHAAQHGHGRFGRTHAGMYSSWSAARPAHFIGHSLGGPTVLMLRKLLAAGFFPSAGDEADAMVRSITTVSSPFRGTPLVYVLGSEPVPYPRVRFLSVGDLIAKAVHLCSYLGIGLDTHAEAWRLHRDQSSLTELFRQLRKSDWAEGMDCAPWDCTLLSREKEDWGLETISGEEEEEGTTKEGQAQGEEYSARSSRPAKTWFRSYASYMTAPIRAPTTSASPLESPSQSSSSSTTPLPMHAPSLSSWRDISNLLSPLALTSYVLGRYDYTLVDPPPLFWAGHAHKPQSNLPKKTSKPHLSDPALALPLMPSSSPPASQAHLLRGYPSGGESGQNGDGKEALEVWYANDGVVPLASQFHPGPCQPGVCIHAWGLPGPGTRSSLRVSTSSSGLPSPYSDESPLPYSDTVEEIEPALLEEGRPNAQSRFSDGPTARSHRWGLGINNPLALGRLGTSAMNGIRSTLSLLAPWGGAKPDDPHFTPWPSPHSSPLPPTPSSLSSPPSSSPPALTSANKSNTPPNLHPSPGTWHTYVLKDTTHASLCPFWIGSEQQKTFWMGVGSWIMAVDEAAEAPASRR